MIQKRLPTFHIDIIIDINIIIFIIIINNFDNIIIIIIIIDIIRFNLSFNIIFNLVFITFIVNTNNLNNVMWIQVETQSLEYHVLILILERNYASHTVCFCRLYTVRINMVVQIWLPLPLPLRDHQPIRCVWYIRLTNQTRIKPVSGSRSGSQIWTSPIYRIETD
jgi:hypothetical protein